MHLSREQYDSVLAAVIRDYPIEVHEGWKADFAAFDQIPGVECQVQMTGDPAALIEARCQLNVKGLSESEVAQELERIWVSEIVFPGEPEEHVLTVSADEIILEAFTIHRNRYITARVIISTRQERTNYENNASL